MLFTKNRGLINYPGFDPNKPHLNISVINIGRRPVKIAKVGVQIADKKAPCIIFANSVIMSPQNVLTEENPRAEYFAEQDDEFLTKIWYVWAEDYAGNFYRKDVHYFPTLWRVFYWLKNRV